MLTIVNSQNTGIEMGYGSEIYTENDIQDEVYRLSQIMKNHCIDVIKGDLTAWKSVISKYRDDYAF